MYRRHAHSRYLIIVMGLCSSSIACAAQDAYPIYALTNANTLFGVMSGMTSLIHSPFFQYLLMTLGLLGLFWMILLSAAGQGRWRRLITYILVTGVTLQLTLSSTVSVQVIGQMDGKTFAIEHVPSIIGMPASWMSQMGRSLSTWVDAAYAKTTGQPKGLTLSDGVPFSISTQLMLDATNYHFRDPALRSSMIHFIVDCGMPLIASGELSMNTLLISHNIWSLFSHATVNPALMTVYFGSTGDKSTDDASVPVVTSQVMTCVDAYNALNQVLPTAEKNMQLHLSKAVMAGLSHELFTTMLDYTANDDTYNPSAGDYLEQAAILNVLNGSAQLYMANRSRSTMLMQSLAINKAVKATEANWETTAAVFAATFGYLYSVVQMLIYAVAPLLLLFIVFPGAMRVLGKRYLTLLAWFPFTFVMLAIANDLILSWTHDALGNIFGQFGGLVRESQSIITDKLAKMQEVGAYIVSLVPLLSWAMLEGGQYAISQIITHSGAQTFGHQAGVEAATGSMSLDSQNYDTTTANKEQLTESIDIGAIPVTSHVAGGQGLLKAYTGGREMLYNGLPSMEEHTTTSTAQSLTTMESAHQIDHGESLQNAHQLSDGARVSQNKSNKLSNNAEFGFNVRGSEVGLGREYKFGKKGTKNASESEGGVDEIPLDRIDTNQLGALSLVGVANPGFVNTQSRNDSDTQQSTFAPSHAVSPAEGDGWDWGDIAEGAVVVGGLAVVGFFTGGLGDVAIAGAAAEGTAELGAAGVASAESVAAESITTEATASDGVAAAEEVVDEAASTTKTDASLSRAAKFKKNARDLLVGGALGAALSKLSVGGKITYGGEYSTGLGTDHGSKETLSGNINHSYSANKRVSDQKTLTQIEQHSFSSKKAPSALDSALGNSDIIDFTAEESHDSALLDHTRDHLSDQQQVITNVSAEVQKKIAALTARSKAWHDDATNSIANHSGLNQFSKTEQQHHAGEYDVNH